MSLLLTIFAVILYTLLIVVLIKNFITYQIRDKWIADKYSRVQWYKTRLPDYDHLMFNLKVWKYIPLDEYNEKYK